MKKIFLLLVLPIVLALMVSCEMNKGTEIPKEDNSSVVKTTYEVGDKGPSGGYIFYDCDADNNLGNADGLKSSECGWRYLEAAPEDVTSEDTDGYYCFGFYRTSDNGVNVLIGTDPAIGKGKTNTEILVNAMGETAYRESTGTNKWAYAAEACDDYSIIVDCVLYDDWFLPSKDELKLMHDNLDVKNLGSFSNYSYWSSSEKGVDEAWYLFFNAGVLHHSDRDCLSYVRPVRAITECTKDVNHSWDSGVTTTPETCVTIYTCTICGQIKKAINYDSSNHSWNGGEITTRPTCGSVGVKTYTCTVCGYTKTEEISATNRHTWDSGVETKAATCANGIKTYTCAKCGKTKAEEIEPVKDHSFVKYTCSVCGCLGGKGPAGGYVFYDCDADNDSGNADGLKSLECGWRYLEAATSNITSGSTNGYYCFGFYRTSDNGGNLLVKTDTAIGTGKANTKALVKAMSETTYTNSSGDSKGVYAAKVCEDYSVTEDGIVYDDWFLPSKDEINLMYVNLHKKGLGSFDGSTLYCSSSENTSANVWAQAFSGVGRQHSISREGYQCVRPIRAFTECNGSINHSWNFGEVTTPATCSTNGVRTYTCTICGQTKTEDISATGNHTYVDYKCSVCGLWGKGPTGGYVFYDCDADNNLGNADGLKSSECGWRYLEAAPEDLKGSYCFGYYRTSDTSSNMKVGTDVAIGTGKANTEALVKAMGETAYTKSSGTTKGLYAAKACAEYSITVGGVVYDDWFLPSKEELSSMLIDLDLKNLGSFVCFPYWSSSESEEKAVNEAWSLYFTIAGQNCTDKDVDCYLRPVRAFK